MPRLPSRWIRTGLAIVALSGCTESPVGPAFGPQMLVANPDVVPVAIESAVAVDGSAGVNPSSGVAVVSGTLSCASAASVTLNVALSQSQKLRRVTSVVEATDAITIDCTGKHFWSVALTAVSGGFQAGDAGAVVTTDGSVGLPLQTSAGVKLYWARR
jgi:spore coat protein U-like protein